MCLNLAAGFPGGSAVKKKNESPAIQETRVCSPGWEDPMEKETTTPVFLPGKSHGQMSLAGYCPWGSKELDRT